MIRVELGIRYISQLRRTRPDETARMESMAEHALRNSGGAILKGSDILYADFDESVIAFWLDLVIAIEGVVEAVSSVEKELLGWACVVRKHPGEEREGQPLSRLLAVRENPTGVWCDGGVASSLTEYASFALIGEHYALTEFTFRKRNSRGAGAFWIRPGLVEKIYSLHLSNPSEPKKAVAIEGLAFMGKRQTLRSALDGISSSVETFLISFDEHTRNLSAVADSVSEEGLRMIGADDPASEAELRSRLDAVHLLKAERLALEISPALRAAFSSFFITFAHRWLTAAAKTKVPIFIVENAHLADSASRSMLRFALGKLTADGRVGLVLTGTGEEAFYDICADGYLLVGAGAPSRAEWLPLISEARASFGLPEADEALIGRCLAMAAENGVAAGYRSVIGWELGADGRPLSVHPHMTGDLLETAYMLSLSHELMNSNEWADSFSSERKPRGTLPLALSRLAELGVIDDAENPRMAMTRFSEFAEKALDGRGLAVRALIRQRLREAIEKKRLSNSYETIAELVKLGGKPDEDQVLDAVSEGVLRGSARAVEEALSDGSFAGVVGAERAEALADIFKSRKALIFGDEPEIRAAFSKPMPDAFPSPRYRAYALLDRAAYMFYSRPLTAPALVQASQSAKNALLLLQGNPADKGLPRAYRLLGETELSRERIDEAVDYFGFAAESAERSGERYEALLSSVNGACTQYLLGNLSNAERYAVKAERRAARLYQNDWLHWSRFMQGRILFETGRYDQAAELFDSLAMEGGAIGLLRNWRDRSLAYGNPSNGIAFLDETADAVFFRLEAALLKGEYEETVRRADAYLEAPEIDLARNSERVEWASGFSLVEDRAIGRNGSDRIVRRLTRAYRAFAMAKTEKTAKAVALLRRIAKEEPISELDPYDAFYFWALSVSLRDAGVEPLDWHTVLGIAFKRLQRRASRIDDAETKRAYLSLNRWNGALFADAKRINLI